MVSKIIGVVKASRRLETSAGFNDTYDFVELDYKYILKLLKDVRIKKAVKDKIRKVCLFISLRNCIDPSVMKVVVIPVLQFNQFGYAMFLFR